MSLTWPDPSSRNTLPNVDFDMLESSDLIALTTDSMVDEGRIGFTTHGRNVEIEVKLYRKSTKIEVLLKEKRTIGYRMNGS